MTRTVRLGSAVAGVAAIYAVAAMVVSSAAFARAPELMGAGVAIDLTLTATALVWFLAVRPGHLRPAALLGVFIAGLAAARLMLPPSGRAVLAVAGMVWGLVELGIFASALVRIRRVVRATRVGLRAGLDLVSAAENALVAVVPGRRLAGAIAVEVAAVVHGLGGWFRRSARDGIRVRGAWTAVFAAMTIVLVGETVGLHMLLAHWSPLAAWIATGSTLYAWFWLAGDAHALRLEPMRVVAGELRVTVGLRWRVAIPLASVARVTRIDAAPKAAPGLLRAHVLWPDVLVELREPAVARGPLGITREVTRITLSADAPEALLDALRYN